MLKEGEIYFNNNTSINLNLYLEEYPSIPISNEEFEEVPVEGRNGLLYINKGTYPDKPIPFTLTILSEDIEIDFDIYDKAYSLMNEFKKRIFTPQISSVPELLMFAYEFEKSNTALLLDIRGRMVRDSKDSVNFNYLTITEIILEEQKHSNAIAMFLK